MYSVPNKSIDTAVGQLNTSHQLEVLLVTYLKMSDAPITHLCTPHQPLLPMGVYNAGKNTDGEVLAAGVSLPSLPSVAALDPS